MTYLEGSHVIIAQATTKGANGKLNKSEVVARSHMGVRAPLNAVSDVRSRTQQPLPTNQLTPSGIWRNRPCQGPWLEWQNNGNCRHGPSQRREQERDIKFLEARRLRHGSRGIDKQWPKWIKNRECNDAVLRRASSFEAKRLAAINPKRHKSRLFASLRVCRRHEEKSKQKCAEEKAHQTRASGLRAVGCGGRPRCSCVSKNGNQVHTKCLELGEFSAKLKFFKTTSVSSDFFDFISRYSDSYGQRHGCQYFEGEFMGGCCTERGPQGSAGFREGLTNVGRPTTERNLFPGAMLLFRLGSRAWALDEEKYT